MTNPGTVAGISPESLLDLLGVSSVPVNLDEVASRLGISVSNEYEWDKDYSGEIYIEGSNVVCWINPFDPPNRQRFTLAHEIGHYINDIAAHQAAGEPAPCFKDGADSLRRDGRQDPSEYRANDFAARLLMPKNLVVDVARKTLSEEMERTGKQKVPRDTFYELMADKFQVSKQAMEIRLSSLGLVSNKR